MENIFRSINFFKYLKKRTVVKKVGFFPGKFNPPHMGHILTILKLSKEYDLIIGLTEDVPKHCFPRKIILKTLKELEEYNIKVVEIKGRLIDKKDILDLPKFDILLSGNQSVINWAKKMKINCKFVKRSSEISASQLRNGT